HNRYQQVKICFPRRTPFFILSSLLYLLFVWLSIFEPSFDYIIIILGGLLYEDITRIFCPVSVIGWIRLESRASHLFQLHDNNSQQAEEYYQLPYTGKFYNS
ncbi:MAG: hypothetical protein IJ644_04195, partial [Oscillospiraceae bacterium]|nr:hypothetical protein [Oscillospiraceae bacterium]